MNTIWASKNFHLDDNTPLTQMGMKVLNVLENYSLPISFIVKNRYAMEDVLT